MESAIGEEPDFRVATRTWIEANFPAELAGLTPAYGPDEITALHRSKSFFEWRNLMIGRGWTAPSWPVEFGGAGLGEADAEVVGQELSRANAFNPVVGLGNMMLAPILLEFGSLAQKEKYLPPMARGEVRWCQGFSEPGAGSDLASLQTRCEGRGDHWLVNGQKVWTSFANIADWCFCLVRTDPTQKQKGISLVLIDMRSDGIAVRPIELINGVTHFCEVFFDDVKVPCENLVGPENGGWAIAKKLMQYERTGLSRNRRSSLDLIALAHAEIGLDLDGQLADSDLRFRLVNHLCRGAAYETAVAKQAEAAELEPECYIPVSVLKNLGAQIAQQRLDLAIEILGDRAVGWRSDSASSKCEEMVSDWLYSRAFSIYGGSHNSEQYHCEARLEPAHMIAPPASRLAPEDRRMLVDGARQWVARHASLGTMHDRVAPPPNGYDPNSYAQMVAMGWPGILVPERFGGHDLGYEGFGAILEELGRTLTPSPLIASAAAATAALSAADNRELAAEWLPGLASGKCIGTVHFGDGRGPDPCRPAVVARLNRGMWQLDGRLELVEAGLAADFVIVLACDESGDGADRSTLFLCPIASAGVIRSALHEVDIRGRASIDLAGVALGNANRLCEVGTGAAIAQRVLVRSAAIAAAEMLGGARQAFDTALDYLRTRVQFGALIGSFQALQHRAADLLGELELARVAVRSALQAIDQDNPSAELLASIAKLIVGDVFQKAAREMIQLHGGIGMTKEHVAGLYLKRAYAADANYGSAAYHRRAVAKLMGI